MIQVSSKSLLHPDLDFVSEMVGASGFDSAETLEQKAEIAGAIGEGMAKVY